uniref:Uncharacterized protein n=1 Tax=Pseudo-nitzschia arenysensis TaxID=697910 RepID=A0A7R9ZTY0_9STRA|mmetsp:Transcript_566/g.1338  ORF Transcript_566/g.1338 Transcript_566/m.1338 type:complete len:288 (+) Transcript_566:106-969(+)|eukprot:CAMPEP_0116142408 /NCGR_PEP_ID=MMETSP0329-20121206/14894_1 /TAXON_ID=697910 /ORGANISM="Pseudo-nitzschia arenysensis, Strain B593" /LENGTH=287 /DNA_ID=CAMNT_0003637645 /DNA_START=93 /DNA_END=956 /DNA_ORIENTATION=-
MRTVGLVSNLLLALSSRTIDSAKSSLAFSSLSAAAALAMSGSTENSCENDNDVSSTAAADLKLSKLSEYHPIVIEGMGYYDPRDPTTVASSIVASIRKTTASLEKNNSKPFLVVTQGDPLAPKGISAITPLVAESLSNNNRGLVCLDESIEPSHSRDADRTNVVLEVHYSQLLQVLQNEDKMFPNRLETAVDKHIFEQNEGRAKAGKPPVKSYFKTYAMLQEVTKAGLKALCGDITIAHTSSEINPFSVTSFYEVGLDLGLYDATNMVAYSAVVAEETLDFGTIDPR